MNRRAFLGVGGALASGLDSLLADDQATVDGQTSVDNQTSVDGQTSVVGQTTVDDVLRTGIARRRIPAVSAMFASSNKTLYSGAFGQRDASGAPVRPDSMFRIASMTKAITTVAALQLVEQGKVGLDEPVSKYMPKFKDIKVLTGSDLHPAKTAPTLRHLLTHTSGLCYDTWDGDMFRYAAKHPGPYSTPGPLMFEPGTRWQYGQGLDWAGFLVEKMSGMTLEAYFQQKILSPLGMKDTSYILPPEKFDRFVTGYHREGSELQPDARKQPPAPKEFNGGGGLISTTADYVRFMQMILNNGAGPGNVRILQANTVELMKTNQIGDLTAGKMKSFAPKISSDVDMQPGHPEKWTLGFLLNTTAYPGGRSEGSLAWAGLSNTFYWIDPRRNVCAVLMMQFLPFVDKEAIGLLSDFERAVYASKLV